MTKRLHDEGLYAANTIHTLPLPEDFVEFSAAITTCQYPATMHYGIRSDGIQKMFDFWFVGVFEPVACAVSIYYHARTERKVVLKEPWSSLARDGEYVRKARSQIARSYRSWPFCDKCKQEKRLVEEVNKDSAQNTVTVYLECGC